MAQVIQLRHDYAANWTTSNPVLAQGEFGYELDSKRNKVGDGVTAWSALGYYGIGNTGAQGVAGTIAVGTVNTLPYNQPVTVVNTGTVNNAILNFSIPQGQAATGAIGTVTTLAAGSNATVTNTGTPGASIFNFGVPQGIQGIQGPSGTLAVGTVSTLAPGASATVTNTGNSQAASLNFGIPAGAAATITVGTVTTGAANSSATVLNGGTAAAAILNFCIPQGIQGIQGPAATIAVGTVSNLAPGSAATVVNAGTSQAASFNFGIPQGTAATLAIGTVNTGAANSSATVTNSGNANAAVLNFSIPQGIQGIQGIAASLAVGTVTNLAPGSNATVVNAGTAQVASLNFGIPQGAAATIGVGTVSTGAAGSSATVTNVGTANAATLNFAIPQGIQGIQGNTGTAATIAVGTVTTLAAGASATVTNAGTAGAASFNFGIPQGAAATIGIGTTTTGAAGSSAVVTNSGTSGAAVLNFTVPQGLTGLTGTAATIALGTVTTGAPGSSVIMSNSGTSGAAVLNFTIPQGLTGNTGAPGGVTTIFGRNGVVVAASGDYTAAQVGAEAALGNPSVSGYLLSSTTAGVRSWIAAPVTFNPAAPGAIGSTTPAAGTFTTFGQTITAASGTTISTLNISTGANSSFKFFDTQIGGQNLGLAYFQWARGGSQDRSFSIFTSTSGGVSNQALLLDSSGNTTINSLNASTGAFSGTVTAPTFSGTHSGSGAGLTANTVPIAALSFPGGSTFLRADGTWQTVSVNLAAPGPIGGTTPSTGAFTTGIFSGLITASAGVNHTGVPSSWAPGTIAYSATGGLANIAKTGTSYDWSVLDTSATLASIGVVTGTHNIAIPNGNLIVSGVVQVTGGAGVAGSMYSNASQGMVIQAKAGSSYDFCLINPANSAYIFNVPTGTSNVTFSGTISATNHLGSGAGLTGTAASLTAGAVSSITTAQVWNAISSQSNPDWYRNSNGFYCNNGTGLQPNGTLLCVMYNGGSLQTVNLYATGTVVSGYSDGRLKDNIKTIQNAMGMVRAMRGISYRANALGQSFGFSSKEELGVIAQEVQLVAPQVIGSAPFDVGHRDDGSIFSISGNDYLTVDYERLVPILIEAIKELELRLDMQLGGNTYSVVKE